MDGFSVLDVDLFVDRGFLVDEEDDRSPFP